MKDDENPSDYAVRPVPTTSLTPDGKLTLQQWLIVLMAVVYLGSLAGAFFGIVEKSTLSSLIDKLIVGLFALMNWQSHKR